MCRDDQLDAPHCAQDPVFPGAQGPRLPDNSFSLNRFQNRFGKSTYNDIHVYPLGSFINTLLNRCLSNGLDDLHGWILDAYLVVCDGIN